MGWAARDDSACATVVDCARQHSYRNGRSMVDKPLGRRTEFGRCLELTEVAAVGPTVGLAERVRAAPFSRSDNCWRLCLPASR